LREADCLGTLEQEIADEEQRCAETVGISRFMPKFDHLELRVAHVPKWSI